MNDETTPHPGEEIIETNVAEELRKSFLEYSMSVIVSRALPDVRDGLKPVHRRILYAMSGMGLRPDKSYTKCAKVVGETMGKYHPHGDLAIYDSLVRLAQDFSLRLPLIDGHGNFGSLDDVPAASRYTECKMAEPAVGMTAELDEDTVDFSPNYDNQEQEPDVLPAAFPNLIVNGAAGIAIGMATNMPPHNLIEATEGVKALIENPNLSLTDLMKHIPGPDMPSGGILIGSDGIKEAYATGRGAFKMRAKAEVGSVTPKRRGIIITELPYLIGPEKIMAKVKELINQKRLMGIADIKDLSDRKSGLKLVIECKTGFDPNAVLEELYRLTPLEESFSINNVALVNNQPETLGLKDLCLHYIAHRREVVRRRTTFRKNKAEARLHIVEGLIIALADIDEVVKILRGSRDADTARTKMKKAFSLSDIQITHILDMPLRRLTSLEVTKLKDEQKQLKATVAELSALLKNQKKLDAQVVTELDKMAEAFGTPRRSKLLSKAPVAKVVSLEIQDDPCTVTLTTTGIVAVNEAVDGNIPPFKGKRGKADVLKTQLQTTRRAPLVLLTSEGRALPLPTSELPVIAGKTRGMPISSLVNLHSGEEPLTIVPQAAGLVLATKNGVVKRIAVGQIPTRADAVVIGLKADDKLISALTLDDDDAATTDLLLITTNAQLLRTACGTIRPQGAPAGGVAGVRLTDGAHVLAAGVVTTNDEPESPVVVITQSTTGAIKATAALDYPPKGRGGGGVRCQAMRKGDEGLTLALVGPHVGSILVLANGQLTEVPATLTKRDGPGMVLDGGPATDAGLARA